MLLQQEITTKEQIKYQNEKNENSTKNQAFAETILPRSFLLVRLLQMLQKFSQIVENPFSRHYKFQNFTKDQGSKPWKWLCTVCSIIQHQLTTDDQNHVWKGLKSTVINYKDVRPIFWLKTKLTTNFLLLSLIYFPVIIEEKLNLLYLATSDENSKVAGFSLIILNA